LNRYVVESRNARRTEKLGKLIGVELRAGGHVGLAGVLGAGKSVLARGVLKGFGIRSSIPSPTFTLVNQYQGDPPVYHVDLYRLHDLSELWDVGWSEIVDEPGLVIVEWFDKFPGIFPGEHLEINIEWPEVDLRRIIMVPRGEVYDCLCRKVIEEYTC